MERSFDYFEHGADIGIIGRGATIERAFEAAAEAMFAVMASKPQQQPEVDVEVAFEEDDPEFALVVWLNRLLAEARTRRLMLSDFRLRRDGSHWRGRASGVAWGAARDRGTEVKGATLTALDVRAQGDGIEARCVVDV